LDEDRISPRSGKSESEVVAEEAPSTETLHDQVVVEEAPSTETLHSRIQENIIGDESSLSSWELGKLFFLNGNYNEAN
jgi:hypothetical protein